MNDMQLRIQAKLCAPALAQYWTAQEMQALSDLLAEKDALLKRKHEAGRVFLQQDADIIADLCAENARLRQVPDAARVPLWSDERISSEAMEFIKKEGAHSTDAIEMVARRMRDSYESQRVAASGAVPRESIGHCLLWINNAMGIAGMASDPDLAEDVAKVEAWLQHAPSED